MTNTILTNDLIGKEFMRRLRSALRFPQLVNRRYESDVRGALAPGDTLRIKRPTSFTAVNFLDTNTRSVQDISEEKITLTLDQFPDVSFALTQKERSLSIQDFGEQFVQPAVDAVAEYVSEKIASAYTGVNLYTGTAADPPDAWADVIGVRKFLSQRQIPQTGRVAVMNPEAAADLLLIDQFSKADVRGDNGTAVREAMLGRVAGIDWFEDQKVQSHTAGTFQAGSPLVNGAVSAGDTSMAIDGGSASETIKKGDLFTVAGVTDSLTGAAKQFVFTADATASTGAIASASFYPAAPTGGFADNAAITIVASHDANLAFNRNAIIMVSVPLERPDGVPDSAVSIIEDPRTGMGIRVLSSYDSNTKKSHMSFDALFGVAVDPNHIVRILG